MQDYGTGASTGLTQTALGKIETGFLSEDLAIQPQEREVLRRLAGRVAEIAASDEMRDVRDAWRCLNGLRPSRPLVFCDPENGWNEIITDAQMLCQGKIARRWEMELRKEIFWGETMGDDKPVDSYFDVPYTVSADDWGLDAVYHQTEASGSYVWDNPLKSYDSDLDKVRGPRFEIDWETTRGCLRVAQDTFGDLLTVRLKGTWWWSLGLTLPAVTLRGLNNLYLDLTQEPDGLKALLSKISQGFLAKLDYLEQHDLLSLNNDGTYVGSGGYGYSSELPQDDYVDRARTTDMWGFCESQETVSISPRMYEEFIFPYEQPIMERFGLNCYGCCEPLHARWPIVKRHPNLRRVSCSAWADLTLMAENLGKDYVLSMKPSPAVLATPQINRGAIRRELREALEITKGCVVEVIMKDNHTIGGNPDNVITWCRIAKEEAERIAS